MGGGAGLACAADFRVGDPACKFVVNFARLGFHHGFALSVTLPAIVGRQRAMDLLLRGGAIDGIEAHQIGLLDRLSEPGEQRKIAMVLAREISAAASLAV